MPVWENCLEEKVPTWQRWRILDCLFRRALQLQPKHVHSTMKMADILIRRFLIRLWKLSRKWKKSPAGSSVIKRIRSLYLSVPVPELLCRVWWTLSWILVWMRKSFMFWRRNPATQGGHGIVIVVLSRCTLMSLWKSARNTSKNSSTRWKQKRVLLWILI